MLCLKGVTDLEPNAEPIRTKFQRGYVLLDMGMRMLPLDDRRSDASLLGLCYVQCRVNIGSKLGPVKHSQSVPTCDHRPRETPQIASQAASDS